MSNIENLYPSEILDNPSKPYIYFTSLPDDILNKIAHYFQQDIQDISKNNKGASAIEDAFSFLHSVIITERAKENAFINYIKNKTQDTIKLTIPNIDSDWTDFVREVQESIDFGNTGFKNLQNEYERLKKNQANFEKAQEKGEQQAWYEQDSLTKTSQQLQKMIKDFKDKTYNATKNSSIIIETIIERYGDSLIVLDTNGKLAYNKAELATVLLATTQMVLSVYNTETYTVSGTNERRSRMTKESLNKILDDSEIDKEILTVLHNFKNIPQYREDMISNYNLQSTNRGAKLSSKPFTDQSGALLDDSSIISQMISNTLRDYKFTEKAMKLITVTNALAEVNSALKFAGKGALKVANTGSAGAKPDNIIGYLTIDLNALKAFSEEERNRIINTAEQIIKKIDLLVESLAKTNTTQYYQDQAARWNMISKEIDQLLKSLEEIYKFLPSCFVIEDSTKNYLSLYSRIEDGELANAPHGGSLGARLDDQLNKIEALTDAGGITMIDKIWLTAAIVNAGPGMIAEDNKNKIENYLSMFAAILLFDGQINIAEEAGRYMQNQLLQTSNVHQIHLFSVNNGYYPLSYVLQLTYNSLNKGLQHIKSIDISEGVQTEIYGFVSKPNPKEYKGLESWNATSDLALKQTKIKMKFLVQFQNIVQNLLQLN